VKQAEYRLRKGEITCKPALVVRNFFQPLIKSWKLHREAHRSQREAAAAGESPELEKILKILREEVFLVDKN